MQSVLPDHRSNADIGIVDEVVVLDGLSENTLERFQRHRIDTFCIRLVALAAGTSHGEYSESPSVGSSSGLKALPVSLNQAPGAQWDIVYPRQSLASQ